MEMVGHLGPTCEDLEFQVSKYTKFENPLLRWAAKAMFGLIFSR